METLSAPDVAALLDVVDQLSLLDDPLPFPPSFLALLARLVDNDEAGYSVLDRRNECSVAQAWWCEEGEFVADGPMDDEAYWRLRHTHPLCARRERTGTWTAPHTVSDFATQRQFRRTAIWNEIYRLDGVNYWLDVGLPPRHGCTRLFIFARGERDFTERDKQILALLRPHLERRAARVDAANDAVATLTAVEEASDAPHDVVLVGRRGTIEFASRHSRELLRRYVGVANGKLPPALCTGVSVARDETGRLTIRATRTGDLVVLLLAEDDGRVAQLTPRQREVLAGVRDGLTDAEIGDRLGIASGTVGKHLEAIYERLDVHTRTAAAAVYRRR
jgi:DNA-binding CsgD family transcriptional regulator